MELELGYSRGAVHKTLDIVEVHDEGKNLQRPGQKLKYSSRARRHMLYCRYNYPKMTYAARGKATGLTMSDDYTSKLATTYGLQHWHAKKCLELIDEVAAIRLLWCKYRAY